MEVTQKPISELKPYQFNPLDHPAGQVEALAKSIQRFGWTSPLVIAGDGEVIIGHGRLEAAKSLGLTEVPCVVQDGLTETERRTLRLADNQIQRMAVYNDNLGPELQALAEAEMDLAEAGFDADEIIRHMEGSSVGATEKRAGSPLLQSFLEPPLSVLIGDSGRWQARKKAWLSYLPIQPAEVGRDRNLVYDTPSRRDTDFYSKKDAVSERLGREISTGEFEEKFYRTGSKRASLGTSMFDPVLAELMIVWFSPPGGRIHDPFGGGVERGLVAASKGRAYLGMDLGKEQVEANQESGRRLELPEGGTRPRWVHGDSARGFGRACGGKKADLLLTCPPYWNLERYSKDPADLSNMTLEDFDAAHERIIGKALATLREDRFAVWVIGDARREDGSWARLPDRTINAFERQGARLHAHVIFAGPIAARRVIARRAFSSRRTVVSRHEHVLVFVKGDPAQAVSELGPVEVGDLPAGEEEENE